MQLAGALLLASSLVLACAGAEAPAGLAPDRSGALDVPREPLEVRVRATRVGSAIRLDVEALGRGAQEGEAFEDPDRWALSARQNDRDLDRLVNGPVHIDRRPAGQDQWDTLVRFSVVFRIIDDQALVRARLIPPRDRAVERSFSL